MTHRGEVQKRSRLNSFSGKESGRGLSDWTSGGNVVLKLGSKN